MRNRIVGFLIIGIAALIAFIIYSFNAAMTNIINTSCTHGPSCPMWGTIDFQTNVSIAIMAIIVIVGLYLIFFGKEERIVTKIKTVKAAGGQVETRKISKESYQKVMSEMPKDDRAVFEKLIDSQGTIFQSDLVEQLGYPKAKVTRILDRLEGKGLVERKRRGMTNVVILKH